MSEPYIREAPEEIVIDFNGAGLFQAALEKALSKARASDKDEVTIILKRLGTSRIPQYVCVDNLLAAVIEQVRNTVTTNCPDCRKPRT